MQTIVQVITTSQVSLRDKVVKDEQRLKGFGLEVEREIKSGRANGWAKLKSNRRLPGALNLSWDAPTKTLVGRIVNRGSGRPDDLVGLFCSYLLSRFRGKITLIQIFQT